MTTRVEERRSQTNEAPIPLFFRQTGKPGLGPRWPIEFERHGAHSSQANARGGSRTITISLQDVRSYNTPLYRTISSEAAAGGEGAGLYFRAPVDNGDGLSMAWLYRRLADLAKLDVDWDSYGGEPPTRTVLGKAARVAERVADLLWDVKGEHALPTDIVPLATGGVQLEWRSPSELLAADVSPGGEWGFLHRIGTGRSARYEEVADLSADKAMALIVQALSHQR